MTVLKGGDNVEQNAAKEIGITLDKYSRTPIYEQVVEQFKKQILTGELVADDSPEKLVALVGGKNLESVYMHYFEEC